MVTWTAARGESGRITGASGYGLDVTYDTRWVAGSGYRPMKVSVRPSGATPTSADHDLDVEVLIGQFGPNSYDLKVGQRIHVPEGTTKSSPAVATISIPPCIAPQYRIRVSEDGSELTALCQPWTSSQEAWGRTFEGFPRVLIAANAMPQVAEFTEALVAGTDRNQMAQLGINLPPQGAPNMQAFVPWSVIARAPSELPQRWIDYSNFDLLVISLKDLAALQEKNRDAFQAILQWTAVGGNLLVSGAGEDSQRAALDGLLGLPPRAGGQKDEPSPTGWIRPAKSLYNVPLAVPALSGADLGYPQYGVPYYQGMAKVAPAPVKPLQSAPPTPQDPSFRYRRYNLGMVVAVRPENSFAMSRHEWNWLLNTLGADRWLWHQRHGVSLIEDNAEFWNFLIPGVGMAPVLSFEVLITLFVLAIGPANYFVLRKRKRLHLLIVTVPLSAAAITLALFGYALISDGLGTRARVRSVTSIDQRQGQAVCWSRLSYYAGLTPGGGLTFPSDVMVVPYDSSPSERNTRGRLFLWTKAEREQWMASGWLPSRTATQFLSVRSRPSAAALRVSPSQDRLEVANQLQTHIDQALVCDKLGKLYWIEDVADGATAKGQPIEASAAFQQLRTRMGQADPAYPPGMNPQLNAVNYSRSRRRYYGRYYGYYQSTGQNASQRTGRLESLLGAIASRNPGKEALLEPGSYVAIVDRSPEVEFGTPAAKEESSLHVIVGKW